MKKKKFKTMRDLNILACSVGELSLETKVIKDKSKYSRKEKHKGNFKNQDDNASLFGFKTQKEFFFIKNICKINNLL